MISEKQKHLIFDINCFYQLKSQKKRLTEGLPIIFLQELSLIAMIENKKGNQIDWLAKYETLRVRLYEYGLSENWVTCLQVELNNFLSNGGTIQTFREVFLRAIDFLANNIMAVINVAPETTKNEYISNKVISDIFEKNYWEGPVINQINETRKLTSYLGFNKNFILELGEVFVKNI